VRRLASVVLFLGVLAGASAAEDVPAYGFVDLTGDFVRFFDSTQTLAEAQRVASTRARLGVPGYMRPAVSTLRRALPN